MPTSDETLSNEAGMFPWIQPESIAREIAVASYRLPRGPSVRLVIPAARLIPIDRSIDSGCNITLRREPPTKTLAPRPGPKATLPLAPV